MSPYWAHVKKQGSLCQKGDNSAVYTCIKKPESFVHSGFSWEVARQLPLNTAKNPNRKTHLRSGIFWNSAGFSGFFCQCKRLLQSRRYYSGFWSRGTWPSAESPDRGPRRNAHYVRSKVERSRACAPLTKKPVWDSGFFAHALFVPKNPNVMGFSGSVNGTAKKKTQVFWILVFANVNGPIVVKSQKNALSKFTETAQLTSSLYTTHQRLHNPPLKVNECFFL